MLHTALSGDKEMTANNTNVLKHPDTVLLHSYHLWITLIGAYALKKAIASIDKRIKARSLR